MASNKKGEVIIPENVRSIVTKYIIHFNIDNTLLLPDCQHESREDQLIQILVHYAWGKIDEKNKFKLSQNVFTKVPKDPESTSYYQALDQLYPLTNDSEENEKIMKTRQDTILNFLKVGTGMKLKPDFDKISKTLQLPKVIHDEIFAVSQQMKSNEVGLNDITDIQKTILQLFQSGYVYILPTLYKTFQNLKKAKKEFSIIFRSSNKQNLEKFVAEFNLFCSGEHPQFNGKNNIPLIKHDGQKNTKNYIIHPSQQVSVFENAGKSLGLEAVFGKLDNQKQGDLESQYAKEIQQEKVKVESGERIYTRMLDSFKESCSMAICENGTQLLVDTYDYNVLQIYFDGEKNTQFQARNIITGEVLPNPEKVSIIDLFKDQDLFMKAIMNAEATRNDEIQRIEKGQELKKNSVTNDWQTLQQSSHDDYLRKTILPLLHPVFIQKQALNLVDIERPDDPISFIAMYILNNKSQVKLPKASQQQQQQDENIQEKQF